MDPDAFPKSTRPLNHTVYGPLLPKAIAGANNGKVAVVTGAGRGIGRAIAEALASSGANVGILDLDVERQAETKAACEKFGVKVEAYACNVVEPDRVRAVFSEIKDRLGPIDILVTNAGANSNKTTAQQTFEQFYNVFEVNLKGTMTCIFEVLNSMRERQTGCIIGIASRAATVNVAANLPYCASKAAVARAIACLQAELDAEGLGEKVHTYALHPGGVWTALAQGEAPEDMPAGFRDIFKDGPELCGHTCAYLATGQAKEIRGMYFDCRQDIEYVTSQGRSKLREKGLYDLKMEFLPGYENEP